MMFEEIKDFMSEAYNDFLIDMYDMKNFKETDSADNIYNFSQEEIMLADCWSNGKGGWWCSWNSDSRLKENISNFSLTDMNWLNNIKIKKYNYIGQNQETIGVLAQELEEIMPSAVKTQKSGYMTVDLSQLLFMTIASLKELKDDVNQLKQENNYLLKRTDKLTPQEMK